MATEPTITVKVRRDLIEQLRPIAARHNRSMHGELRTALEDYIGQHGRPADDVERLARQVRAQERKRAR
jgi:plasmid stability protein